MHLRQCWGGRGRGRATESQGLMWALEGRPQQSPTIVPGLRSRWSPHCGCEPRCRAGPVASPWPRVGQLPPLWELLSVSQGRALCSVGGKVRPSPLPFLSCPAGAQTWFSRLFDNWNEVGQAAWVVNLETSFSTEGCWFFFFF